MLLTERHTCPVCGSDKKSAVADLQAFDFEQGLEYLAPLLETEGDGSQALLPTMKPYHCTACGARFLDPWLTSHARSRVFVTGHPIHNVGWRNFVERLERNLTPDLHIDPIQLINTLDSQVDGLETYLEFGCPFQGILLHLAKRKDLESYRAVSRGVSGMTPRHSRRFLVPVRVFMGVAAIAKNIAFLTSALRTFRDRIRRRFQTEPALSEREFPALRKYFVPLESSKFWGMNCSVFGESCAATAMSGLGATVISRSELRKLGKIRKSCIGLFNVLDHQDDPIELLRECLMQVTAVVVLGHEPPLGIQHHFGLGSDFFERLPNFIDGLRVQRLSDKHSGTLLYLLSLQDS